MKQNLFHIADSATRMKIYSPMKMNKGLRVGGNQVVGEDGVWSGVTTNIKELKVLRVIRVPNLTKVLKVRLVVVVHKVTKVTKV